jgi:hypothetical protein
MRHTVSALVLLVGLAGTFGLSAQQPAPPPIQQTGGFHNRDVTRDCGTKVCAPDTKATTKVVYGSTCKEYCQPRCSLAGLFRSCCGTSSGCADCECGDVRTKRVLLKKTVPGPSVPVCVVKDVTTLPTWIQPAVMHATPKPPVAPLASLPPVVPAGGPLAPTAPLAPDLPGPAAAPVAPGLPASPAAPVAPIATLPAIPVAPGNAVAPLPPPEPLAPLPQP